MTSEIDEGKSAFDIVANIALCIHNQGEAAHLNEMLHREIEALDHADCRDANDAVALLAMVDRLIPTIASDCESATGDPVGLLIVIHGYLRRALTVLKAETGCVLELSEPFQETVN